MPVHGRLSIGAGMSTGDHPKRCVLLVDDDEFTRGEAGQVALECGFDAVKEASNGSEAIAIVDRDHECIDLILCDVLMPDMDGIEVIEQLSHRQSPPPIAFLSGADEYLLRAVKDIVRVTNLTYLGVVDKPITKEKLEDLLKRLDQPAAPPVFRDQDRS